MSNRPILITGATGKTGRRIAARLEAQGQDVRRGSRTATTPFDWENPQTWDRALDKAEAAYICLYPDFAFPGAMETLSAFLDALNHHGVERAVMITGRGEPHAQKGEALALRASTPVTILRSAWFAQNFTEGTLRDPLMQGVVAMPGGDIREPIIDLDDFADAAARVLSEAGHEQKVYDLTGPELLTFAQIAQYLSKAIGRPIEYLPISFDVFREELAKAGDATMADIVTDIARETFDGRNAHLSSDLPRLLGRLPRRFEDFATRAAKAGVWAHAA